MEQIRYWRSAHNFSLKEAGALVGVSGVQWHRYETGARKVSYHRVLCVESVTGISRHELRPDIYGPSPKRPGARASA